MSYNAFRACTFHASGPALREQFCASGQLSQRDVDDPGPLSVQPINVDYNPGNRDTCLDVVVYRVRRFLVAVGHFELGKNNEHTHKLR